MTIPVPAALRPWVAAVEADRADGGGATVTLPPDPLPVLVFRRTAAGDAGLIAVGPRTRATYHEPKELPLCLRLRLRPGRARPLLGVPVSELVDRAVPLADLWGPAADELTRALTGLAAQDAIEVFTAGVAARLADRSAPDIARGDLLHDAALRLSAAAGPRHEPVRLVARRLSLSERHLRNLFTDHIGLTPKQYARIDRVRTVLAHGEDLRWAQAAMSAGYYDQSHLTAEFRALMGVPPAAFAAGRRPPLTPCATERAPAATAPPPWPVPVP